MSTAENRIIDPNEWIRRQKERLQLAAAVIHNQHELATEKERAAQAQTSRLVLAFAPIAGYIHQLAKLGVQIGVDRPGVDPHPLAVPEGMCSDYRVSLKEVTYRGLEDEHSATWGFGVRAVRPASITRTLLALPINEGEIAFEFYDFEPATGLVARLTSLSTDEVLERFLYALSKVTVAVSEVSL